MAVFNVNDIVQVTMFQTMNLNTILNVHYYRCVTPDVLGTYESICAAFKTNIYDAFASSWGAGLLAMQSNQILHTVLRVQRIKPVRSVGVVVAVALNGLLNDNCDTNNSALSITKRTPLAGRAFLGRMQVGGIPKSGMQGGEWSAGTKASAGSVANALVQPLTAGVSLAVFNPCLFHRTIVPNFTDITSSQVQASIRTMHRRTLQLGI